ncbi:MAG: PAQR family membrane homeostasis protein TrhA [Acidiferrobacteraceae bacterium]
MLRGERFNSVSHLAGAVLALGGSVVLIVLASLAGDPWRIVGFSVYGVTLVLLYLFSGIYHGASGRVRAVFRRLDYVTIYLLIAGTYTPFVLGPLRGGWGWSLFGILWGLAVLGIVQEFIPQRTRKISLMLYMLMGWLVLIAWKPLIAALSPDAVGWLAAGGMFYSIGIIFFILDERWRYGHQVWHAFVLAGSFAQYVAVLSVALAPTRFA